MCGECSEHFTRRSSGRRHNDSLHGGSADIVPLIEYIVGRSQGMYIPIHPSWTKRSAQRWKKLDTTKSERVVAAIPDSTRGIVKQRYDSNLMDKYSAHESKVSPIYSGNKDALVDTTSRQQLPFSYYTVPRQRSYDYLTLQRSFKCNLLFPDFLPPNTMLDLLELEELLLKFPAHQAFSPQLILQNAIDQCKRGDNGFLVTKLNQLRQMNSLNY